MIMIIIVYDYGYDRLIVYDCTKPSLVYDSMNHIQIVSIW